MARKYTKVESLIAIVRERKARGETNKEIGESLGLSKKQIKELVCRQNRKERMIAAGHIPRPKGRPRKRAESEEAKRNNEIAQLRMTVELLRNFLSEAGRR